MSREQTLREFVLDSTANGYESFLCIQEQIEMWVKEDKIEEFTKDEIAAELGNLIRSELIRAYELSPQKPHSKVAEFGPERLDELWYLVTAEGMKLVKARE